MAKREETQLQWEDAYLSKLERINKIIYSEKLALMQMNAATVFPGQSGSPVPPSGNAISSSVVGNFSLPSTIKVASISGGQIAIPTGSRTEYHKARDIAAKNSSYAGFQSINEDMYSFPNCPEENMFAPDFIPILILMHTKIAPALKVDKIKLNSGTRKTPIDVEWDAHMGGYAVDMGLTGNDRYVAADICWGLGLRGVAIGNTFVHVDAGPDPIVGWGYGSVPVYRGPGSKRG